MKDPPHFHDYKSKEGTTRQEKFSQQQQQLQYTPQLPRQNEQERSPEEYSPKWGQYASKMWALPLSVRNTASLRPKY